MTSNSKDTNDLDALKKEVAELNERLEERRRYGLVWEEPTGEEDDPYESTQITALVANAHGIFGVFSMREVFEYTRFWAVGSGREFALGAMHAHYPGRKSAAAIASAGIAAGATFDRNSALPMTLYTVAPGA